MDSPYIGYSIYTYHKGVPRKYFRKTREEALALAEQELKISRHVSFGPVRKVMKKNLINNPGTGI